MVNCDMVSVSRALDDSHNVTCNKNNCFVKKEVTVLEYILIWRNCTTLEGRAMLVIKLSMKKGIYMYI